MSTTFLRDTANLYATITPGCNIYGLAKTAFGDEGDGLHRTSAARILALLIEEPEDRAAAILHWMRRKANGKSLPEGIHPELKAILVNTRAL